MFTYYNNPKGTEHNECNNQMWTGRQLVWVSDCMLLKHQT